MVWDLTGRLAAKGARPKPALEGELDTHWNELASDDATRAYSAIQWLTELPSESVAYLAKHVHPFAVDAARTARIRRLIADLDTDDFASREKAVRELRELGDAADTSLRAALAANPTLEQRRRVEAVLAGLQTGTLSPERLRELRAVEVQERIGTPGAWQVLEKLARGAPEARLTREAKASLERLVRGPGSAP
jgi:hypothetical protein